LKPYLAGQKGVSEMLTNQVNEFSRVSGMEATLETVGDERPLSVAGATALYRVTQESLANVLKHAAASRVDVTLSYEPGQIRLEVVDDGQGFDPKSVVRGYGLENMNNRAEELDGSVTIESVPGDGTRVTVTLPV
ncbi:MAG: sensor histidine kinase, partial [Chloroflexi bacterium]|nr:sensor histidine kinase [Chloroflexota bacterium]